MPGVPQKPFSPEKERTAQLLAFYPSSLGGDDLWHPCNWDPATGNLIVTADLQASSITIGSIKLENRDSNLKTNVLLEGDPFIATPASGIPIIIKDETNNKYRLVSSRILSDALQDTDLGIIMYGKISNFLEVTGGATLADVIIAISNIGGEQSSTTTITRDGNGDVSQTIQTFVGFTITTTFVRDGNGDVSQINQVVT
jgi:hypothetical protein